MMGATALKQKPKKAVPVPSARPRLVPGHVDSPTVPGARETVMRVFDTLHVMLKRKQLTQRQHRAGEMFRSAFDALECTVGRSMDFDRVRSQGMPGARPAQQYAEAADTLHQARCKLTNGVEYLVIDMVCGKGYSLEQTAREICGADPKTNRPLRKDHEKIGYVFKIALSKLADLWNPDGRNDDEPSMRSYRAPGAKPTSSELTIVPQAKAVHANGRKIFRTG